MNTAWVGFNTIRKKWPQSLSEKEPTT